MNEEELEKEFKINAVAKQISDKNLDTKEAQERNAGVGWDISGPYELPNGELKEIFFPQCRLSNDELKEAIFRANKLKS